VTSLIIIALLERWQYYPTEMPRDFFDPTPEQQKVILVDAATLRRGEKLIESCEHCNSEGAEIPFDNFLIESPLQIRA